MKKALLAVVLLLFWASSAVAQRDGVATFSATDPFEVDSINLTNLVPSINIPVMLKSVGPINGSLRLELNEVCFVVGTQWTCNSTGGTGNQGVQFLPIVQEMIGMTPVYSSFTSGGCTRYTITGVFGSDMLSFYPVASTTIFSPPLACGAQTATGVKATDGSGYTFSFGVGGGVVTITNNASASGWTVNSIGTTLTDPFSNTLTDSLPSGNLTDTLGAVTSYTASPAEYTYKDTTGTSQNVTLTSGTSHTFVPLGGTNCGASGSNNNFTPITAIGYPDGTSYSFGWQTNGTGLSGLINSITLRTGGQISYTYTWNTSCTAGGWGFSSLTRTTPDGAWSYTTSTANQATTTTRLDPGKNKIVWTFGGSGTIPTVINEIDRYQNTGSVASPSYTLISTTKYCYNSPCVTNPTYPITIRQTDEYLGTGSTHMSQRVQDYDSYGNVTSDATTDEITSQTITTTYVYGTYSSGTCSSITNTEVNDHPCTITTKNGSTWLSERTYTYNSNGALTSSSICLSSTCTGSSALTTTYTPTTQGTYSAIQDPNGQTINYTFGSCNSLMPTDVTTTVNSIAIDHKATWNCDAGVVTDTTDANSNEDDTAYDSMNRIHTYHDRMGDTNTTTYDYGTPTLDHVKVTDNVGVVSYTYNDGLGRPTVNQTCETTGCTTLDTVSHAYGWTDSMSHALTNFQTTTSGGTHSAACTTTTPGTACSTVTMTALTNLIAGPYKTTDANSGTVTFGIGFGSTGADSSVTVGPAPSGEHTKVVQTEVDGFGRVDSVCDLENTGGTTCGQALGNSGILTTNTYSFATGAPKVVATRGSQSHTTIADAVGRTTSVQTPEAGTVTYVYDSIAANYCFTGSVASSSAGDLVATTDAAGNKFCIYRDGLHRITDIGNSNQSSTNPCKRFRYDSTGNKYQTAPTGYPASPYILGRLMEAETDDCTHSTAITDEWFAYDKDGRVTDMWQSSTNSGGVYHTTVAYDADGQITSLSGIPGYSTVIWGVDGEDRWNSMTYGSTTIVSATAGSGFKYDAAGAATNIPIGSGTNQDSFTYDQLENMLTYTFPVGSNSDAGTLTWNSIGSLGKLVINDTVPSSTDSQTCTYAYDDASRLTSVAGASCNATQTFGYDQYDNLWQSGSFSWGCSTCYSSSSNEQTGTPTLTYDSNGNVKYDQNNTYTWNVDNKMASEINSSTAAVCGTSGTCNTFDAFGNLVEQNAAGTYKQYVQSPMGFVAIMLNGQTSAVALVPAPGHGYLFLDGSTAYFNHTDWLDTERLITTISGNTVWNDQAYAPYSQTYDTYNNGFGFFTGDISDVTGLFYTPNREFLESSGRWLSPDKCKGCSWNGYAYATDPLTQTDPSGLDPWGQEPVAPAHCPIIGGCQIDQPPCLDISDAGTCKDVGPTPIPGTPGKRYFPDPALESDAIPQNAISEGDWGSGGIGVRNSLGEGARGVAALQGPACTTIQACFVTRNASSNESEMLEAGKVIPWPVPDLNGESIEVVDIGRIGSATFPYAVPGSTANTGAWQYRVKANVVNACFYGVPTCPMGDSPYLFLDTYPYASVAENIQAAERAGRRFEDLISGRASPWVFYRKYKMTKSGVPICFGVGMVTSTYGNPLQIPDCR